MCHSFSLWWYILLFDVKVIEHKPYDHKADVFSFGIALWELLTGEVSCCFDLSIHFMDVFYVLSILVYIWLPFCYFVVWLDSLLIHDPTTSSGWRGPEGIDISLLINITITATKMLKFIIQRGLTETAAYDTKECPSRSCWTAWKMLEAWSNQTAKLLWNFGDPQADSWAGR